MGKSCSLPFAYTQVAILILSLTFMPGPVLSEQTEAPAVLQFSRKYQAEQIDLPRYNSAPSSQQREQRAPVTPIHKPAVEKPVSRGADRHELARLQQNIARKEQEIGTQNQTIKNLENKLSQLQLSAKQQAKGPAKATSQDVRNVQKMAASIRQSFSFQPDMDALKEKLRQSNKLAAASKAAEATMREKQNALTAQISGLNNQLTELKNNAAHSATERQAAINAQLKELNAANEQLKLDLVESKKRESQSSRQILQLNSTLKALESQKHEQQSSEATLAAEKKDANEKLRTLQDKLSLAQTQQKELMAEKQLLEKRLESELSENKKNVTVIAAQLQTLRDKLAAAQQLLSKAPTSERLAESQSKILALQTQLDSALIQQKKHSSELAEAQSRTAALNAEKKAAEDKVQALQQLLSKAPTQEQLAENILKVKVLQNEVDNLTLLSLKENTASKNAGKVSDVVQGIEKQVAEDKLKALQVKLDSAEAQLAAQEKQTSQPKIKGVEELTAEKLKKVSTREAYAIGVSLGEEILQIQAENRDWTSTESEKPSVLAGIVDSFQGKPKLSPQDLQKTLINVSEKVNIGREKLINELDKSTKKFIANFAKQKNAKKSNSGFWYRISYAGDTPIPEGATIDVVVKESLTNGVVIEDMDTKGIALTQPISAFPPVFREALSMLKNHGSMTIVVPPALAYGDKGYPPKVPPNATMVYELRVSDIYPVPKK